MASQLACLNNVVEIRYRYDRGSILPARFRRFFKYELYGSYVDAELNEAIDELLDLGNTGVNAQRGLDTLMCALATSGVRPRTMELAVSLENHHVFKTYRSDDSIVETFRDVETLSLRNCYSPL